MSNIVIPLAFISDRVALDWHEVLWGFEHELLDREAIIDLAIAKVMAGSNVPDEVELACVGQSEAFEADEILRRLAKIESDVDDAVTSQKWTFLKMAWIYEGKKPFREKLMEAEMAYADFGYPREVEDFIRYMPAKWGYDPKAHSYEENEARLSRMWKQYLDEFGRKFRKS